MLEEYDDMKEVKILIINVFNKKKKILISEKRFTETNYERLRKNLWFT